jgi:hypothetical protein
MAVEQWTLPTGLSTVSDVSRVARELQKIDSFLHQSSVREPGKSMSLPKTSRLFDEIVSANNLNMLHEDDRKTLQTFLTALREKAPVLHMSFNVDPSPLVIQKLTDWIRQNIHHFALIQVGLAPSIGAGCLLRTTNKYFDFSLKHRFKEKRPLLMEKIRGKAETPAAESKPAVQEQPAP